MIVSSIECETGRCIIYDKLISHMPNPKPNPSPNLNPNPNLRFRVRVRIRVRHV